MGRLIWAVATSFDLCLWVLVLVLWFALCLLFFISAPATAMDTLPLLWPCTVSNFFPLPVFPLATRLKAGGAWGKKNPSTRLTRPCLYEEMMLMR